MVDNANQKNDIYYRTKPTRVEYLDPHNVKPNEMAYDCMASFVIGGLGSIVDVVFLFNWHYRSIQIDQAWDRRLPIFDSLNTRAKCQPSRFTASSRTKSDDATRFTARLTLVGTRLSVPIGNLVVAHARFESVTPCHNVTAGALVAGVASSNAMAAKSRSFRPISRLTTSSRFVGTSTLWSSWRQSPQQPSAAEHDLPATSSRSLPVPVEGPDTVVVLSGCS